MREDISKSTEGNRDFAMVRVYMNRVNQYKREQKKFVCVSQSRY